MEGTIRTSENHVRMTRRIRLMRGVDEKTETDFEGRGCFQPAVLLLVPCERIPGPLRHGVPGEGTTPIRSSSLTANGEDR
eukprot:4828038-Pyramimonas_sp.AAC.1